MKASKRIGFLRGTLAAAVLGLALVAGGCDDGPTCDGLAVSCFLCSEYECYGQSGCYWSSVLDDCSGVVKNCDEITDKIECVDQLGCDWTE
jgi:hypothetical protein